MGDRERVIRLLGLAVALMFLSIGQLVIGCKPTAADDDVADDDDDSAEGDDDTTGGGDDDDDSTSMPPDPTPLTLTLGGGESDAIVFDAAECVLYPNPSNINFRTTWRGAGHNAVLIAEIMGAFTGAGLYDVDGAQVRVKLQSEAGSPYNFYYQVDTGQGDTGSVDVAFLDAEAGLAWGEFTFSGMHGTNGTLTASPMPIPIWCDDVQN